MDETLFPLDVELSSHDRADATYKDADPDENKVVREASDAEDEDVYKVKDEWGTLYMEVSKRIYKSVVEAVIQRSAKMATDFAITAWVRSVDPVIMADVATHMDGQRCNKIEKCVRKLLSHNIDGEEDGVIDRKIDTFWDKLKQFQCLFGSFLRKGILDHSNWFNSTDCTNGNSAKWHAKYFAHHTKVLGFVVCHTTFKIIGCGAPKRSWTDCKEIKTGKRTHLSGNKLNKQATLYTSSCLR